jgi:hypothetical protein
MMGTVGALFGTMGIVIFEQWFFDQNWKLLYMGVTLLGATFHALQVCLCYGYTFGLPLWLFATGDSSLQSAMQYVTTKKNTRSK